MFIWQQTLAGYTPMAISLPLIVTGDSGRFQYSADGGATLTQISHGQGTSRFTNVVRNNQGELIVGCANRRLLASTDGITWYVKGTVPGTAAIMSVGYTATTGRYVVVTAGGGSTTRVYVSTSAADGTWTAPSVSFITSSVKPVPATNGQTIVFAGATSGTTAMQVAESTATTAINFNFGSTYFDHNAVFYHDGIWLGGGQGAKISTATTQANGTPGTFTLRTGSSNNAGIRAFAYDSELGLYVAVGNTASAGPLVMATANPATNTWASQPTPGIPSGTITAASSVGATRVLGASDGKLYATTDWQSYTLLSDSSTQPVTSIYVVQS